MATTKDSYKQQPVPTDPSGLRSWLDTEHRRIAQSLRSVAYTDQDVAFAGDVTINGILTVETAGSTFASSIIVSGPSLANITLIDQDASADETAVHIRQNSGVLAIYLTPDATPTSIVGATQALKLDRTGLTFDGLTLNGAQTVTGLATFTQTGTASLLPTVLLDTAAPKLMFNESDAAANTKRWDMIPVSGQFRFRIRNDADDDGANVFLVNRTGIVLDSISTHATGLLLGDGNAASTSVSGLTRYISLNENANGATLGFELYNGDGTNNQRLWLFNSDADNTMGLDFTYTTGLSSFEFRRAGTAWLTLNPTAGTVTLTPQAVFTQLGTASIATIRMENNVPLLEWEESDAAADEKTWQFFASSGALVLRTINDANNSSAIIMQVDRTGITVDTITFPQGQMLMDTSTTISAPDYSFNGDANTGLYRVGADDLALVANGAAVVRGNATGVGFNGATPAARPDYTVTNPSTDRAFDVSSAAIGEVRAVLGTLISDLIAIGLLQ